MYDSETVKIQGILRYREDLGQGVRTGVLFGSCKGKCERICSEFSAILKPFPYENLTGDELRSFLLEEDRDYLSRRVNVTLLGKDPLRSPRFCRALAKDLKNAGLSVDIHSCALGGEGAVEMLLDFCHLFVFTFLTTNPARYRRLTGENLQDAAKTILHADRIGAPFRLRIPVMRGVNTDEAEEFSIFCSLLKNVKSVILDFSYADFSDEEKRAFRASFFKRGIILY